jgi:hypothetical protein
VASEVSKRERKVCTGVFYLPPEEQRALGSELATDQTGNAAAAVVEVLQRLLSQQATHSNQTAQLQTLVSKNYLALSDRLGGMDTRDAANVRANLQTRQEMALLRQAVAANNALVAKQAQVMEALLKRLSKPKPVTVFQRVETWLAQPGHKFAVVAVATLTVFLSIAAYVAASAFLDAVRPV